MVRPGALIEISRERHLLTVWNPAYGAAAWGGLASAMRAARENTGWLLGEQPIKVRVRTGEDGEVSHLALL